MLTDFHHNIVFSLKSVKNVDYFLFVSGLEHYGNSDIRSGQEWRKEPSYISRSCPLNFEKKLSSEYRHCQIHLCYINCVSFSY